MVFPAFFSLSLTFAIRLSWSEPQSAPGPVFADTIGLLQRRQWHPTPVLLPGKSYGQRSLVGCSPWVARSHTRLSNFTFTFFFPALEKEMATQSSVLAWRVPGMGETGGLPSMGLHRVGHNWETSLSLFTFLHWRRKWQPTAVFLPGEFQGRGRLMGCHLWGRTESDRTEATYSSSIFLDPVFLLFSPPILPPSLISFFSAFFLSIMCLYLYLCNTPDLSNL